MAKAEKILVLRTCAADMTSHNGFLYPRKGPVEAPDWEDTDKCGHGLHGLPWGCGRTSYLNFSDDTVWLVLSVAVSDGYQHGTGNMRDKCKFRRGSVVFAGTRAGAVEYIGSHGAADKPVVFALKMGGDRSTLTGGYGSTLTGGYGSTLTSGDRSTLTGGYGSTLTSGDRSTLTGGYGSTLTSGYGSTLTSGDRSTLTGGYGSTLTSGYGSTLTSGYGSTLTSGDGSTLTGGDRSTLTSGDGSTLTGGYGSILQGRYFDGNRIRITTGYIGENGLLPNTPYLFSNGTFSAKE